MPGKRWTAVAAIAAVVMLAGCSPDPEPIPTPTGFASEAEAFAAAEETYRAYVEAGNEVDLSDPGTFEPLFAWTTGELNELDRESLSGLHADGVTIDGEPNIVDIQLDHWDVEAQSVHLHTCQDVSDVEVLDASGNSLVSPDRKDLQAEDVTLVATAASPTGLLIERIEGAEEGASCGA